MQTMARLLRDVVAFSRAIRRASPVVWIWGLVLNAPQAVGVVFLPERPIAGWTALCAVGSLVVAAQIHRRAPYSRLTGLCHLPWLLLAPLLVREGLAGGGSAAFRVWCDYVAITMTISLCFDAYDVARYVAGRRAFRWSAVRAGE